ncbi:hypothetical protein JCM10296v2_006873 [Rhodotorula toruloides]
MPARPTSSHSSSQPPLSAPQQALHSHSPAAPLPPPPDLFVLVRPPPGSSAHPLNLQVQLLVPSTAHRAPTGGAGVSATSLDKVAGASVSRDGEVGSVEGGARRSGSFERARSSSRGRASPGGTGSARVSRSPSLSSLASRRSGYSAYSGESGVTGTSSATGTGTGTGSGRRKVTPLLNLAFHSVLPTVVTDAGTDQRVAKFAKRGVEFTGLAIFDPVDLALANSPPPSVSSGVASPPASRLSPTQPRATNGATSGAAGGGGGFLGKFKRLSFNPASSSASPSSTSAPDSRSSKLFSSLAATPTPSTSSSPSKPPSDPAPSGPSPHTLPLVRTSSPPHTPSPSTPAPDRPDRAGKGYAFVLRKWLRADLEAAPRGVRVEWSRRRLKDLKNASRRGSEAQVSPGEEGEKQEEQEDDDDEDPDTPWVCTLVYPLSGAHASPNPGLAGERSGASSPVTSLRRGGVEDSPPLSSSTTQGFALSPISSTSAPTSRRLHLATLRPAPYHPKLVSTLLLPPLLPSIPLGTFHPSRGLQGGVLGPEELRDLVMVSAMWVAVREGLGGLEGVKVETGLAGMSEGVEQVVAGLKEKGQGVKKVVSIGSAGATSREKERKGGSGLGIRERLFR